MLRFEALKFYINFREGSGEIWKVTNELDISTPYVEIDRETMLEFTQGVKDMTDYIVVPSSNEKSKYEIQFKHKDLSDFDVDLSIHHLPKVSDYDLKESAVVIKQNVEAGTWTVIFTAPLRDLLNSTQYYKDKNQIIYVTKKDDPNILLDTLDIKMINVLLTDSHEMQMFDKNIAKMKDISLYCGKVFEQYYHIQE